MSNGPANLNWERQETHFSLDAVLHDFLAQQAPKRSGPESRMFSTESLALIREVTLFPGKTCKSGSLRSAAQAGKTRWEHGTSGGRGGSVASEM